MIFPFIATQDTNWQAGMAENTRKDRFPATALKALLCTRPFPMPLWEAATSPSFQVRIANDPARYGKVDALAALSGFLQRADGFGGGFCEVWAIKETIYIETELDCQGAHGSPLHIPCSVVARTMYGLLYDLRLYLDPSPLSGTAPSMRH
jgi:hypothetical protein